MSRATPAALFDNNEIPFMCSSEFRGGYEAEVLVPQQQPPPSQHHHDPYRTPTASNTSPPKQFVFPLVRIRITNDQISIFDGPVREVFFSQWQTVTDIRHRADPATGGGGSQMTMLMIFDEVKGLLIIRNRDAAAITALLKAIHLFASVPDRDLAARQQLGLPTTAPSASPERNNTQFQQHHLQQQGAPSVLSPSQPSATNNSHHQQLDMEHQLELERLRSRTESMRRDISVGNLRSSNRRSESRFTTGAGGGSRSESRQQPGYLQDTDSTTRRRQAAAARRSTSNPRSEVSSATNGYHHQQQTAHSTGRSHNNNNQLPPQYPTGSQQHHTNVTPSRSSPRQTSQSRQRSSSPMQEALSLYEEKLKRSEALAAKIQAEFQQDRLALRAATAADQFSTTRLPTSQQNQTDVIVDELRLWMATLDSAADESKRSLEKRGYSVREAKEPLPLTVAPQQTAPVVIPLQQQQQTATSRSTQPQFESPPASPVPATQTVVKQQQQQQEHDSKAPDPLPFNKAHRPPPLKIEDNNENSTTNNNITEDSNIVSPMSAIVEGKGVLQSAVASPMNQSNNSSSSPVKQKSLIQNTAPPPKKSAVTLAGSPTMSIAEQAAAAAASRKKKAEEQQQQQQQSAAGDDDAAKKKKQQEEEELKKKQQAEKDKAEQARKLQEQIEIQAKKKQEEERLEEEKRKQEEAKKAEEARKKQEEANELAAKQQQKQAEAYAKMQEQLAAQSATAAGGDGTPIKKPPPPNTLPPPPGSPAGSENHSVADGTAKRGEPMSPRTPVVLNKTVDQPKASTTAPAPAEAEKPKQVEEPKKQQQQQQQQDDDPHAPVVKGVWQRMWAEKQGKYYYVNLETKKKTWSSENTTFADEAAAAQQDNKQQQQDEDLTVNMKKGSWKRVWAESKGKPYYENTETGEKTWKKEKTSFADGSAGAVPLAEGSTTSVPASPAAAGAAASKKDDNFDPTVTIVKGDWKRIWNADKNKHYYVEISTKRSTYKIAETSFADGTDGASELKGPASPTASPRAGGGDSSPSSPTTAASPSPSDPTQPLVKGEWKRLWNADKNKHYYVHMPTRKSTYKVAETSFADGIDGAASPGSPQAAVTPSGGGGDSDDPIQPVVKGEWKRLWADQKKKHYYVHLPTKKTTWKVDGTSFE